MHTHKPILTDIIGMRFARQARRLITSNHGAIFCLCFFFVVSSYKCVYLLCACWSVQSTDKYKVWYYSLYNITSAEIGCIVRGGDSISWCCAAAMGAHYQCVYICPSAPHFGAKRHAHTRTHSHERARTGLRDSEKMNDGHCCAAPDLVGESSSTARTRKAASQECVCVKLHAYPSCDACAANPCWQLCYGWFWVRVLMIVLFSGVAAVRVTWTLAIIHVHTKRGTCSTKKKTHNTNISTAKRSSSIIDGAHQRGQTTSRVKCFFMFAFHVIFIYFSRGTNRAKDVWLEYKPNVRERAGLMRCVEIYLTHGAWCGTQRWRTVYRRPRRTRSFIDSYIRQVWVRPISGKWSDLFDMQRVLRIQQRLRLYTFYHLRRTRLRSGCNHFWGRRCDTARGARLICPSTPLLVVI